MSEDKKFNFVDMFVEWVQEDFDERKPIFDEVHKFMMGKIKKDDLEELLNTVKRFNPPSKK